MNGPTEYMREEKGWIQLRMGNIFGFGMQLVDIERDYQNDWIIWKSLWNKEIQNNDYNLYDYDKYVFLILFVFIGKRKEKSQIMRIDRMIFIITIYRLLTE